MANPYEYRQKNQRIKIPKVTHSMYLIETARLFVPIYRLVELEEYMFKKSRIHEGTEEFIKKSLKPGRLYKPTSDKTWYARVKRGMYKKLMTTYLDLVIEKMLEGHTVVLPGGLGRISIQDFSTFIGKYNIKTRGQTPLPVIEWVPKKTKEIMKTKGYIALDFRPKGVFLDLMEKHIQETGVRFKKTEFINKKHNEQHPVYQPQSNPYVTGKSFQKQAVR